jgi:hypothetical protein
VAPNYIEVIRDLEWPANECVTYRVPRDKFHNAGDELAHSTKEHKDANQNIRRRNTASLHAIHGYQENTCPVSRPADLEGGNVLMNSPVAKESSPRGAGLAKLRCTTGNEGWVRSSSCPPLVCKRSK